MVDLDAAAAAALVRNCDDFVLDAGLAVTAFVPGCLLPEGTVRAPVVAVPDVALHAGHVLTRDADAGALAGYYRGLAAAARGAGWRGAVGPYGCVAVNVLLAPAGEWPVLVDMFAEAAMAADELLGVLADASAPGEVVYDNLDQGWAVRVVVGTADVTVMAWDWERPLAAQEARVLRLPRAAVAVQAGAARARLRALHAGLVEAVGVDLWNTPARVERPGWWRRLARQGTV